MLWKLQRSTIIPIQIIGYSITLFIGVSIILMITQIFIDVKPLLYQQSDIFKNKFAVINKNISVFKTINKEGIYFTNNELNELNNQTFIKETAKFNSARFKILAKTSDKTHKNIPVFYTDLFFESIPDKFLSIKNEEWNWDSTSNLIPIVIPKDYLKLYNFGFAESQGLPVLSENTISQWIFNIKLTGKQKSKYYESKIVDFSDKINSILVPEDFLSWANKEYGNGIANKTSRLLVEFNDPSDEAILKYFNEKNYSINKEKLEFSKLTFFFKSAIIFVFFIAVVIIVLSISFILLSINLIIHKNKELILNLYNIGYSLKRIAAFYQIIISTITFISIILAILVSYLIRNYYLITILKLFNFKINISSNLLIGLLLILLLVSVYNGLLIKNIKKIIIPKKQKKS